MANEQWKEVRGGRPGVGGRDANFDDGRSWERGDADNNTDGGGGRCRTFEEWG